MSPRRQLNWPARGTKALGSAVSLSHTPGKIPKGISSHHRIRLQPHKHPTLCFCGSIPPMVCLLPVLQGPSHRGPPTAKQDKPSPPTPVHLVDPDPPCLMCHILSKQHQKPGSVQVAQTGATPLHSESCPGRGEDKVHTSLTVAPVVGWGQTSGVTAAPPTNTSYYGEAQRTCPAAWSYRKDYPK